MSLPAKAISRLRHHATVLSRRQGIQLPQQQRQQKYKATMTPPTKNTTSTHNSAAPWRNQFLEHTGKMESPEFVLSTISHTAANNFGHSLEPRARFCVFRGTWATLPPNKHNDAPRNADEIESDCLTFTTDLRMTKCKDFFLQDGDESVSGGGAPVEAVWWINTEEVKTQWRVRGDVWVIAPDFEKDAAGDGPQRVKAAIEPRMRSSGAAKVEEFDWWKEVTAHFGNLSPGMRGSFKNPPPGKPVDDTANPNDMLIGQLLDGVDDAEARKNFRVVVIRPFRVESTDLIEPREARRQEYVFDEVKSEWKHKTLWP